MRCFRPRIESSFGAVGGQEANGRILLKQDIYQSSDALHDNEQRAISGGLCLKNISVLHLMSKIIYRDHAALKYLLSKKETKSGLI